MRFRTLILSSLALQWFLTGCGSTPSKPAGPIQLKGAGATSPQLVYSKWAQSYPTVDKAVTVEYVPTGSGEGIRQLEAGSIDFAASDVPISDEELAKLKTKFLHFPTFVSAIVPVYNVAGVTDLKVTGELLASIFSGKVKTWNDSAIAKLNPGVSLPAAKIIVAHRSDASGSTYTLTDYLTQVSPAWKSGPGRGANVKFADGIEASGSEAMANLIQSTPNAIGYVDINFALKHKLATALVQNAAGKFQQANLESMSGALSMAENMQKDFRASVVNPPGEKSFPICTLTWLIVPAEINDGDRGRAVKRFLRWALTDGQQQAMSFDYGIIQPPLIERIRDQVELIKVPK